MFKKYIVFESGFAQQLFDSQEEAQYYINNHKPGLQEVCWIEEVNCEY